MGAQGESPPGRELPGPDRLTFVVAEEEAGGRVDSALAEFAGLSRSRARRWIEEGRVRLDQKNCRPSQRVRAGAVLEAVPRSRGPLP